MRALRSCFGLLGTLALAGLPASAGAQKVGPEFQINTYTTNNQHTVPLGGHLVAADASGSFVVVWQSVGQAKPGIPMEILGNCRWQQCTQGAG